MTPDEFLERSLRWLLVEMWKTNAEEGSVEVEFDGDGTSVKASINVSFDVTRSGVRQGATE